VGWHGRFPFLGFKGCVPFCVTFHLLKLFLDCGWLASRFVSRSLSTLSQLCRGLPTTAETPYFCGVARIL
jgi:hypothetical protein